MHLLSSEGKLRGSKPLLMSPSRVMYYSSWIIFRTQLFLSLIQGIIYIEFHHKLHIFWGYIFRGSYGICLLILMPLMVSFFLSFTHRFRENTGIELFIPMSLLIYFWYRLSMLNSITNRIRYFGLSLIFYM